MGSANGEVIATCDSALWACGLLFCFFGFVCVCVCVCLFVCLFVCFNECTCDRHMEVPGLGTESEPQL